MRRPYVFVLQSLIAVLGSLLLFTQCRTVPEDSVLPVPTLRRGSLLGDPVVMSEPQSVTVIKVNNTYDNLFATEFAKFPRPTSITIYDRYVRAVETIKQDGLPKHEFSWVPTQRKNVMVAIFKNLVMVDSKANQISNKSDLVWLWTPPVGALDPGRVTYAEGQAVSLNQADQFTFGPPVTLNLNTFYVWCVLAWDSQGLRIEQASRELPLLVR